MPENGRDERVTLVYRALVSNRFAVDSVETGPSYLRLTCHRFDEYGVRLEYLFILCDVGLDRPSSGAIESLARRTGANVLVIGESAFNLRSVSWDQFVNLCGGPVRSWLPFDLQFPGWLEKLGKNETIPELDGKPDDLFEELVQLAFQFILGDRVVRYGQARAFERVPDGLAFAGSDLVILYDSKAYANGYEVTAESIRQFSSYVDEFNGKYASRIGRVFAFVVTSGSFVNGRRSMSNKSNDLYARCQTGLVFLNAEELGKCVALLKEQPRLRNVLNWRQLLSRPELKASDLESAAHAILADGVIG